MFLTLKEFRNKAFTFLSAFSSRNYRKWLEKEIIAPFYERSSGSQDILNYYDCLA